jgi:hypothetical protein
MEEIKAGQGRYPENVPSGRCARTYFRTVIKNNELNFLRVGYPCIFGLDIRRRLCGPLTLTAQAAAAFRPLRITHAYWL